MKTKFNSYNLLGAILIGLSQFPANAQTTIQTSTQESNITGDNNQVYQIINQTIYTYPNRGFVNRQKDRRARPRFSPPPANDETHRGRGRRHGWDRRDDDDDD